MEFSSERCKVEVNGRIIRHVAVVKTSNPADIVYLEGLIRKGNVKLTISGISICDGRAPCIVR